MPGFPLKRIFQIGKWAAYAVLTLASLYILYIGIFMLLISRELYLRNFEDTTAKNSRGDQVFAETDFSGLPTHPAKTVIWLRRAYHPFSTTLLEAYSYDILVGLKWQDDDNLILQLDLGCDGHNTKPVARVGPIRILYDFGDPGHVPKVGYETFRRRDLPPEPCP